MNPIIKYKRLCWAKCQYKYTNLISQNIFLNANMQSETQKQQYLTTVCKTVLKEVQGGNRKM